VGDGVAGYQPEGPGELGSGGRESAGLRLQQRVLANGDAHALPELLLPIAPALNHRQRAAADEGGQALPPVVEEAGIPQEKALPLMLLGEAAPEGLEDAPSLSRVEPCALETFHRLRVGLTLGGLTGTGHRGLVREVELEAPPEVRAPRRSPVRDPAGSVRPAQLSDLAGEDHGELALAVNSRQETGVEDDQPVRERETIARWIAKDQDADRSRCWAVTASLEPAQKRGQRRRQRGVLERRGAGQQALFLSLGGSRGLEVGRAARGVAAGRRWLEAEHDSGHQEGQGR
jgi:hypothetical protein